MVIGIEKTQYFANCFFCIDDSGCDDSDSERPFQRRGITATMLLGGLVGAMNLLKMGGRCAVLTFSPPERRT